VVAAVVVAAVIGAWALVVEPAQRQAVADRAAAAASASPTPTVTSDSSPTLHAVPAGAPVLIVGDSYSEGHGAAPSKGYADTLSSRMKWSPRIEAFGGTGYTWGGGVDGNAGKDFLTRLNAVAKDSSYAPSLVVLQGSQNDYRAEPEDIKAAAKKVVTRAREAWPDAQIVLLGPVAPEPLGHNLAPINDAVAKAALESKVPFVDGLAWFTPENSKQYALEDGAHLNQAGHDYLAAKTREAIGSLIAS
jgi:lysophospholipase L1-like esterase